MSAKTAKKVQSGFGSAATGSIVAIDAVQGVGLRLSYPLCFTSRDIVELAKEIRAVGRFTYSRSQEAKEADGGGKWTTNASGVALRSGPSATAASPRSDKQRRSVSLLPAGGSIAPARPQSQFPSVALQRPRSGTTNINPTL